MTETKEQMTDLMATIQLPEEGIRQLLDAREQLEKEGHWDVIVQTAEQVMTADGELSVLTKHWKRQREEKKHLVSTVIFSTH